MYKYRQTPKERMPNVDILYILIPFMCVNLLFTCVCSAGSSGSGLASHPACNGPCRPSLMGWTLGVNFITLHLPPRWKVSPRSHFDHASLAFSAPFCLSLTSKANVKPFQKCIDDIVLFEGQERVRAGRRLNVITAVEATLCADGPGCYWSHRKSDCVYSYAILEWVTGCFFCQTAQSWKCGSNVQVLHLQGFDQNFEH